MSPRVRPPEWAYEQLGLPTDCPQSDIRPAYRRLAKELHPDLTGGDDTRFKELAEAYGLLATPELRELNDSATAIQVDPDDPFGGFDFGEEKSTTIRVPRNAKPPKQRRNLHRKLKVPYATARDGGEIELSYKRNKTPAVVMVKVPPGSVSGDFVILKEKGAWDAVKGTFGDLKVVFDVILPSPGADIEIQTRLSLIDAATGVVRTFHYQEGDKPRTATLAIPSGMTKSQWLRFEGLGGRGEEGAEPGDLLIWVELEKPKAGRDVTVRARLSAAEAQAGGSKRVRFKVGGRTDEIMLNFPPGVVSGHSVSFFGRGEPGQGGPPGSLTVVVEVDGRLRAPDEQVWCNLRADQYQLASQGQLVSVALFDPDSDRLLRVEVVRFRIPLSTGQTQRISGRSRHNDNDHLPGDLLINIRHIQQPDRGRTGGTGAENYTGMNLPPEPVLVGPRSSLTAPGCLLAMMAIGTLIYALISVSG